MGLDRDIPLAELTLILNQNEHFLSKLSRKILGNIRLVLIQSANITVYYQHLVKPNSFQERIIIFSKVLMSIIY